MSIPLDEIKQKTNIEDIIGEYTQLYRSGKNYKGLCPFHDDNKTLSLSVVTKGMFKGKWTEGFFYCFGCGVGGDVVKFIQLAENLDFKESCKMIAKKVNIKYTEKKLSDDEINCLKKLRNRTLTYVQNLMDSTEEADIAYDYLIDRDMTDEDIQKWRIGYVKKGDRPNEHWLEDRISYPILSGSADKPVTIGMGYRVVNDSKSKNKFLFDEIEKTVTFKGKNKVLYGLNFAKQAIRQKQFVVVVEGYNDVISMHKTGFENTVASCGTHLSPEQRRMIKNLTNKIYFYYDGDKAGINKMKENLPALIEEGFDVFIIISEDKKDPDEKCREFKFDYNKMAKYISKNKVPGVKLLVDEAIQEYENTVFNSRQKVLDSIMPVINSIPNENAKKVYESTVFKRLDLN